MYLDTALRRQLEQQIDILYNMAFNVKSKQPPYKWWTGQEGFEIGIKNQRNKPNPPIEYYLWLNIL